MSIWVVERRYRGSKWKPDRRSNITHTFRRAKEELRDSRASWPNFNYRIAKYEPVNNGTFYVKN